MAYIYGGSPPMKKNINYTYGPFAQGLISLYKFADDFLTSHTPHLKPIWA
jgi:hypothetical protein